MKCETVRELLVAYEKGELDEERRAAVEEHLAQCVACRAEAEGARRVVATLDQASDEPIERIAKTIIEKAIEGRASDIHVQPGAKRLLIRYRIDGVLHDAIVLPTYVAEPLAARLRQMADLPLTERAVPQDGRIRIRHDDREYDLRMSLVPSLHGDSIVIRILDPGGLMFSLDDLGMHEETREQLDGLLHRPNGLVLVSGPTGSGKTTTLYAALKSLVKPEVALFTIEDPVEYRIDGITQIRLNRKAGMDFAAAMRHVLRQDPDVILCAEIRDRQTLDLVVQAALTGHLVLTTLHTNDAIKTIRRMMDIGLERFLIAQALLGVLAQRLVRKVHLECGELHEVTNAQRQWLLDAGVEDPPDTLTRGTGCPQCRGTGCAGRTAIHELLVIDDELREMIGGDADLREVERLAAGKREPMRADAARKVLAGEVDIAEAMRVTAFVPDYD